MLVPEILPIILIACGRIMSSMILTEPFIDSLRGPVYQWFAGIGTISARCFPNRVILIGWRVLRICSISLEQFALNSVTVTSVIGKAYVSNSKLIPILFEAV